MIAFAAGIAVGIIATILFNVWYPSKVDEASAKLKEKL